ncbi:MAG: lysophospholipid acyltransferase family protein, partial [Kiritimatiellia bacterium]|nr:lysophospholipid acyltransferase family protein [Kiritimatiellia bacterium]
RSSSDPFLMACLPGEGIQWVKSWPFRLPILGLFARGSGYLSVYEMSKEELLAKSVKELRDGCSIIVFPEGTRSVSREMGSFHGLVFRLALQTGAPIVPVCLSGSEDKPRRGSLALHPGRIRVKVLPALKSSEYMEWSSFHLKQEVRERIRRELDRMEGVGA